jgi:hypothetical protein
MPTVVRDGRFLVKVYAPPREHPPAHVHVEVRPAGEVVVRLALDDDTPAEVWQVKGDVAPSDVLRALRLVEAHEARIRTAWEALHGS